MDVYNGLDLTSWDLAASSPKSEKNTQSCRNTSKTKRALWKITASKYLVVIFCADKYFRIDLLCRGIVTQPIIELFGPAKVDQIASVNAPA